MNALTKLENELKEKIEELRKEGKFFTTEEMIETSKAILKHNVVWNFKIIKAEAELSGIQKGAKAQKEDFKEILDNDRLAFDFGTTFLVDGEENDNLTKYSEKLLDAFVNQVKQSLSSEEKTQ